jgi:hypothetical protein
MTPEEQLGAILANEIGGRMGEFRPCAIFQERLDSIRVVVRDCSLTATRINEVVTVLEDSHFRPGTGVERYVGFTIKGVKHFCRVHGIDTESPVRIADVLDAVLKSFPEEKVELAIDGIARRLVDNTSVDLTASSVVVLSDAA